MTVTKLNSSYKITNCHWMSEHCCWLHTVICYSVGGVSQWLTRRSLAGRFSLIYTRSMV